MESCSQKLGWAGTLRLQWIRAPRHQLPPWLFREICSIRFLFTAVSLLSIFLAGEEQRLSGTPALDVGSQVQLPRWPSAHSSDSPHLISHVLLQP